MEVVNGTVSSVSTQRVHFAGIDWLRGFAAFFIVGCHIGLLDRTVLGAKLTHFCDMNVGVFAAISGFLFFRSGISRPNADFGRILEKRIKRLLSMYLIWSLFYLAIRWLTNCVIGGGGFSRECARGFIFWGWVVFGGGAACTLWFLINLLYAQTAICILCKIAPRLLNNIWFTAICAFGMLFWSIVDYGYLGYYTARLFSFVLLGWSLALCREKLPGFFCGWAFTAMVCLAFHFCLSASLPRFARDFVCVIPILMCAITLPDGCASDRVGTFMASTSMGVYLWHPLVAVGVQRIVASAVSTPYPAGTILLAWLGTYVLALAVTVLVGNTPLRRFQI